MNRFIFWTAVFMMLLIVAVSQSQSPMAVKKFSDTVKVVTKLENSYIIVNTNRFNYVLSSSSMSGFVPMIAIGDSIFEYYEKGKIVGVGVDNEINLFEVIDRKSNVKTQR